MERRLGTWLRALCLLAVLAAVAAWGVAPTSGAAAPDGAAPLGKGWGRVVASGTVVAVDRRRNTVTLSIARGGRVDWFQGGTAWRESALAGTRAVRLLAGTLVLNAGAHAIPLAEVRSGEPAVLWAVARPDAEVLGLVLEVSTPQVTAAAAAPGPISRVGVVVGRTASTVDLLTNAGSQRSVVMTAATVVRTQGRAAPQSAVALYDILHVDGPLNSDGSIVATTIDVNFAASSAAQVSGPVAEVVSGVGGLVIETTMVSTSSDTYVVRDGARGDLAQAASGRPVTVYGVPVRDGDTAIGLAARVVVMR